MGGVFTDKFIVQRLTEMRWMAVSSTEEDGRVYENARILVALRESLKKLQIYYEGVVRSECPPLVPNEPHPRYFPYRTSFASEDETLTHIRYQRSLEDDARCVTYLANIIKAEEGDEAEGERSAPPEQVVVKFVGRYGIDVHKFLADKGWAPRLRYYGRLRETMGSDEIRRPGQRAAAGLYLESNVVHMVVMDYIDEQPKKRPADAGAQIEEVLTELHANGYVFGDLREPNILFGADLKVKLIDFDWSGRYEMKNGDEMKNTDGVEDGEGRYAHYPLAMSTRSEMWEEGMKRLRPIRPEHDLDMLKKLQW